MQTTLIELDVSALLGNRTREQRKEETKSRTDLAPETFLNPLVQQEFSGCFAERRSSQTPDRSRLYAFSSDGRFALWWWQGRLIWITLVRVWILMVMKFSKIPQGMEVFLLFQLQPLNFQQTLKLTNLVAQPSIKIQVTTSRILTTV